MGPAERDRFACELEPEVLAAVLQSRWPGRVDPLLREHVAACPICSDVAAIAVPFDEARAESRAASVVPDAGSVWWRARLRARREAAEAAARPIAAAQVVAFACAVVLLAVGLAATLSLVDARTLLLEHGALACAMAAAILLVPAAIYLAVAKD